MAFKITKKELKGRVGYILLGFFTFFLVKPLQDWIDGNSPSKLVVIGLIGLIATLYFFDFE